MKMKNLKRLFILTIVFVIATAVTMPAYADAAKTMAPKGKTEASRADLIRLPNGVIWAKYANEYKYCVKQAYANAENRLKKLAENEEPGKWCVVFDMDETIVSNVDYEIQLYSLQKQHNKKIWYAWCASHKSPALPGAVKFAKLVKKMGGQVIVITNRLEGNREPSRKNLDKIGFPYDAVVIREGKYAGDKTKEQRRTDLENGELVVLPKKKKMPPLKIIMLAGDQSHDFYDPSKMSHQEAMKHFDKDFIILPNPLYGGWADVKAHKYVKKARSEIVKKVKVGDNFTIKLKSNPATGYKWELSKPLDTSLVRLIDFKYQSPAAAMPGKGGVEIWNFKAAGKGETKIRLRYVRPWEKDTLPAEIEVVRVIVE